jgi:membrane protein implicated in regulation of membrane protease activity
MRLSPGSWSPQAKAAILSASLTLAGAGALVWSGLGARTLGFMSRTVDTAVIILMVPATAIVLAIFMEAVRLTWRGHLPRSPSRRPKRTLVWTPGRGEG